MSNLLIVLLAGVHCCSFGLIFGRSGSGKTTLLQVYFSIWVLFHRNFYLLIYFIHFPFLFSSSYTASRRDKQTNIRFHFCSKVWRWWQADSDFWTIAFRKSWYSLSVSWEVLNIYLRKRLFFSVSYSGGIAFVYSFWNVYLLINLAKP